MSEESFWWFTDEQKELSKKVTQFVDENMEEAERHALKGEIPWPLLKKVGSEGYFGAAVPKKYGGLELGATGCAIVSEQMSRLAAVGTLYLASTLGGTHQLLKYGTEEQKQKWLSRIAKGNELGAITITEPFVGSDAAGVMTTAVKDGDEWIVNGKKRFITGGGIASRYFIYVKTSEDPADRKNYSHISAFIIEKGTPGFSLERVNSLIAYDNVPNSYLNFNDVRVPDNNRIGAVGKGWSVMMAGLNFERLMGAVNNIGNVRDIIPLLFHYTKRRVQFNKTTSRIPGIQNEIANIIAKYRMARVYVYNIAKQLDDGEDPALDASSAKWIISENVRDAAFRAIQVMGGDGLTKFFPVERIARAAKISEIAAGTSEVQKMIIYRFASKLGLYNRPVRLRWDDELNFPIKSNKESRFKGLEVNEENVLKVIAHDYKVNPGLYMTPDDVREDIGGDREKLLEIFNTLKEQNLIVTHNDRTGKIALIKANYDGLKKAFPDSYYQWFPKWYSDADKF